MSSFKNLIRTDHLAWVPCPQFDRYSAVVSYAPSADSGYVTFELFRMQAENAYVAVGFSYDDQMVHTVIAGFVNII